MADREAWTSALVVMSSLLCIVMPRITSMQMRSLLRSSVIGLVFLLATSARD